jgi:hypothetical protein
VSPLYPQKTSVHTYIRRVQLTRPSRSRSTDAGRECIISDLSVDLAPVDCCLAMLRASLLCPEPCGLCWSPATRHIPESCLTRLRPHLARTLGSVVSQKPLKHKCRGHSAVVCSKPAPLVPETSALATNTAGNALGRLYVSLLPGKSRLSVAEHVHTGLSTLAIREDSKYS